MTLRCRCASSTSTRSRSRAIGQWPWPRTTVARLVDQLAAQGAAAIAFDILFAEPDQTSPEQFLQRLPPEEAERLKPLFADQPSHDAVLAEAIGRSPTVLATALTGRATDVPLQVKAGFAVAGDDPLPFLGSFAGQHAEPADPRREGVRDRRDQLDPGSRPGGPAHIHRLRPGRPVRPGAVCRGASRRAGREHLHPQGVERQRRGGIRPADRAQQHQVGRDRDPDRFRRRDLAPVPAVEPVGLHSGLEGAGRARTTRTTWPA